MNAGTLWTSLAPLLLAMAPVAMAPVVGLCQDPPPAGQPQASTPRKTIVIADHDWPPYLFAGKQGSPKGIIKEVVELCLPATGYTAEFKFYPINRMFSYLEEGKIDVNIMSFNRQRDRYARYGEETIFVSSYHPFVLAEREIQITSLHGFDDLKLGHLAGLRYSPELLAYVEARIADGTAVTTLTQESLIKMLLAGRIDVFVLPRESLAWRVKTMGVTERIKQVDYCIRSSEYFVTISRKSLCIRDKVSFLESFDTCLREAKKDGRYAGILRRYGIE